MYEYIKGTLVEITLSKAVVDVHGIGYSLFIPFCAYTTSPKLGEAVLFYISTVIREDSHRNFAFLNRKDRDLFEQLIEISGIGPKTALALVGNMESGDLEEAISNANINLLSKIPGIGKKTAERLVVEMRDKIDKTYKTSPPIYHAISMSDKDQTIHDALNALVNLGYNTLQAQKAIKKALTHFDEIEPELGELIKVALKGI